MKRACITTDLWSMVKVWKVFKWPMPKSCAKTKNSTRVHRSRIHKRSCNFLHWSHHHSIGNQSALVPSSTSKLWESVFHLVYAEKRERNLSLYDLLIPMPMSLTTAALLMLRKSFELNVSPAQYSFKRNYSGTFRFVRWPKDIESSSKLVGIAGLKNSSLLGDPQSPARQHSLSLTVAFKGVYHLFT